MGQHPVTEFKPYEFKVGEKIRIEGGPRGGDWEVIGLSDKKVKLRCPVSGVEVEWARFCYFTEHLEAAPWPKRD